MPFPRSSCEPDPPESPMAIERATGVLLPDEGCAMRKRSRAETTLSGAHLCGELLLLDRSSCSLSDEQPSGREAGSEVSCEAGCEAGPGRARAAWNTCLLLASRAVAFSKRSHRSESSVCMPLSDLVRLVSQPEGWLAPIKSRPLGLVGSSAAIGSMLRPNHC